METLMSMVEITVAQGRPHHHQEEATVIMIGGHIGSKLLKSMPQFAGLESGLSVDLIERNASPGTSILIVAPARGLGSLTHNFYFFCPLLEGAKPNEYVSVVSELSSSLPECRRGAVTV